MHFCSVTTTKWLTLVRVKVKRKNYDSALCRNFGPSTDGDGKQGWNMQWEQVLSGEQFWIYCISFQNLTRLIIPNIDKLFPNNGWEECNPQWHWCQWPVALPHQIWRNDGTLGQKWTKMRKCKLCIEGGNRCDKGQYCVICGESFSLCNKCDQRDCFSEHIKRNKRITRQSKKNGNLP